MEQINRKKVRTYFVGKSQLGPVILIVLGIITAAFIVGLFLIIAGVIWALYNVFTADLSGQAEVDRAIEYEKELATRRAYEKLNVVAEQLQNVAPVVIYGRGYEPNSSAAASVVSNVLKRSSKRQNLDGIEDPIYRYRIGADSAYRYSLVKYTTFMFGETQLYVYYSYVDLTTGFVYAEGTNELFYSDINAICFSQEREKLFNFKKRKFQRILMEQVKVLSNGCSYTAYISTEIDRSVVDREFTGMRNLIREKKNA